MIRIKVQRVSGGLIALGIVVLLFPIVQYSYSKAMSKALQKEAQTLFMPGAASTESEITTAPHRGDKAVTKVDKTKSTLQTYQSGLYPEPAPDLTYKPKTGDIIGMLTIPDLGIHEAILEGTGPEELAKAPGHLPDSVFPGQVGTSIIAAHNSSSFRHLDQLAEGMEFTVTTEYGVFTFSVTGQRILHVDEFLPNMAYPAIALETCFPLDALYLTDKRLFVEAALIKSEMEERHS